MTVYDSYPESMLALPQMAQRMEQWRQQRIMKEIKLFCPSRHTLNVLEIGGGVGLFAHAVSSAGWNYSVIDRSQKICDWLSKDHTAICAEVPPFPKEIASCRYDLIYASFVLEHMKNGVEAHAFVQEIADHLALDGIMALVVPDCLSLGIEFWNIDYTHTFPTTERNVRQICNDSGLECRMVQSYRGPYITGAFRRLIQCVAFFYRYRLFMALFGRRAFWYSLFQYINQDVLLVIASKKS